MTQAELEKHIVQIREDIARIRAIMEGEDGCLLRCREMRRQVSHLGVKVAGLTVSVGILTSVIMRLF